MAIGTALVTGASAGIGMDLARIHAERGGDVVLVARRVEKLERLRDELESRHGVTARVFACDLSEPGAGSSLFAAIESADLDVEYLINNAGFGGAGRFHDRPLDDDLAMIQLNVVAVVELTRCFLPRFVAAGRGRILNVSSTASLLPGGPLQAVYFATKAFVTSFSHGLAGELDGSPVTVTALLPGATATEFAEVSGLEDSPLFSTTAPARGVAEDGYRGMMAGRLQVVTGLSPLRRVQLALAPLAPREFVLDQVRRAQQVPD